MAAAVSSFRADEGDLHVLRATFGQLRQQAGPVQRRSPGLGQHRGCDAGR